MLLSLSDKLLSITHNSQVLYGNSVELHAGGNTDDIEVKTHKELLSLS